MTAPTGATLRPWATSAEHDPDGGYATIYGPDGDSFVNVSWQAGTDSDVDADAAFIVYAVNNIEAITAERDEALRLLRALVEDHYRRQHFPLTYDDPKGEPCKTFVVEEARAFLRAAGGEAK